ncbi:hypothetical protein K2X85_20925 [bacterium]|nr:hypothetical protein [bacterium]
MFEDFLDAWPVEEQPLDRPYQLYHPSGAGGFVPPQDVADLAHQFRDADAIDERLKECVSRPQWISLLNIWIVSDLLEDWFRHVIKVAGEVDTELLWQAICRQLLKITVEGDSPASAEMTASDTTLTPSSPDGPVSVPSCPVSIDPEKRKAYVNGKPVDGQLTSEQITVLNALIDVYPTRLTIDEMRSIQGVGDPVGVFKRLIENPPWSTVLSSAGRKKNRYGWVAGAAR